MEKIIFTLFGAEKILWLCAHYNGLKSSGQKKCKGLNELIPMKPSNFKVGIFIISRSVLHIQFFCSHAEILYRLVWLDLKQNRPGNDASLSVFYPKDHIKAFRFECWELAKVEHLTSDVCIVNKLFCSFFQDASTPNASLEPNLSSMTSEGRIKNYRLWPMPSEFIRKMVTRGYTKVSIISVWAVCCVFTRWLFDDD